MAVHGAHHTVADRATLFVFLPYGEDGEWDPRGLLSGQAFEHVGDETYIWYGAWDLSAGADRKPRGAVGLLTMRRDGFGGLSLEHASLQEVG